MPADERIEWIEFRACGWNDAADPVRLAKWLRRRDGSLKLNDRKRLVIVASIVRDAEGADASPATEPIAIEVA